MSDYGSELDFDEDVESQLAEIEQRHQPKASTSHAGPSVQVEYDGEEAAPDASREKSLWELYRRGGSLSVSDLIGPLWCEYQHVYRLHSKQILRLPPESRPSTFHTPQGTEIAINLRQVEERAIVLEEGNGVHGKLEREVNGVEEKIEIRVRTREEGWVLRIVNLLNGLKLLAKNGIAREIPVAGLLESGNGGIVVFGIIDQVERKELPPTPPAVPVSPTSSPTKKKAKTEDAVDSKQTTLDAFFSSPSKGSEDVKPPKEKKENDKSLATPALPGYTYVLSDTKTRYNFSVPRPNATKSAQIQLMLYRSLLSPLLSAAFPWSQLFAQLDLDPSARLSELFLLSILEVLVCNGLLHEVNVDEQTLVTLQDFVAFLNEFVKRWFPEGRNSLSEEMEISYRLRNAFIPTSSRSYMPRPNHDLSKPESPPDEDHDLAEAIRLSLLPLTSDENDSADEEELSRVLATGWALDEEELSQRDRPRYQQDELDEEEELLPFLPPPPALSISDNAAGVVARGKRGEEDDEETPLDGFGSLDLPPNSQVSPPQTRYNLRRRAPPPSSKSAPPSPPTSSGANPLLSHNEPLPALPPNPTPPPPSPPPPPEPIPAGALIGTQTFRYSQKTLDDFLKSSIGLWQGDREPIGVDVEETRRCRTCEFESACEWREKKVKEAVALNRENARKATSKRGRE